MSAYKIGRWSLDEIETTKKLVEDGKTYREISELINRPEETVKSFVENKLLMNLSESVQLSKSTENDFKTSAEWKELSKQLSLDEQELFIYHWISIIGQFKHDVTHTERLQIIDVVRTEILLNRVLSKIHFYNQTIESANHEYCKEMSLDPQLRNPTILIETQKKISDSMMAIGAFNKELSSLTDKKQSILKDIKGTREQRVKRVEDSKESITGWVAALLHDGDLRHRLGVEMEKARLAQEVEYERLSDYYKYEDGSVEQPILNADNLKEDNT